MKTSFLPAFILILPALSLAAEPQPAVVVVPVADVWSAPSNDPAALTDDKRETQILFGEKVLIHESSGAWVRIEAVDQPTFRQHNKWEGYPGWMIKTNLAPNTNAIIQIPLWPGSLRAPTKKPIPQDGQILFAATKLIRLPYLWGGLSQNGMDCSGLVHLTYRISGIRIPRDAHEQWMKAKPIERAELKPADLIFSAKADNPKTITHVALYAGNGQIIEAPQTGMVVRKISFKEKYGKPLEEVESGDTVGKRVIYFGSFLMTDKSRS